MKGKFFLAFLLLGLFFAITKLSPQRSSRDVTHLTKSASKVAGKSWISETRRRCVSFSERNDLDRCFRSVLRDTVKEEGTQRAVVVLQELRDEGVIDAKFDDHQHVHEIGRETAKLSGVTVDAFLSCPSMYNYGCQHGFFEYALTKAPSPKDAAVMICEGIPKDKPPKLYAYCYHGVGHGLMMAQAYDLKASLDTCNALPNKSASENCWQGVFMENMNAVVLDDGRAFGFVRDDPLAPCNKVEKHYQWQCYINHAGYLTKITNLDLRKASEICLSAGEGAARPCIQSIGLMTTNPIWQKSIKGVNTILDQKKNVAVAWQLCKEMDTRAYADCVIGAVGNILNFDEIAITRASSFCDLVDSSYTDVCYREIGRTVLSQVMKREQAVSVCETISKESSRKSCLLGMGGVLQQDEDRLFISDDTVLKKAIKEEGPARVVEKLSQVMPKEDLSCHDRAHEVGRFAYEILGADAFTKCSSQCHSGCYHGATEAYFNKNGTANLQENLSIICSGELNRFFFHQCIHGVGHGLMAWSNYELFEALAHCDGLESINAQSSCWTGVFMENIVGSLNKRHATRYLNSDPHYPCSIVSEKHKGSCYFLQTSRMIQLFDSNFKKIVNACASAPPLYQRDCFLSMGRDASGSHKQSVDDAFRECQFATKGIARTSCIEGAVQDTFWDPSGKEKAIRFCSLPTDREELRACWQTITTRASEVLSSSDYQSFCKKVPSTVSVQCAPFAAKKEASVSPTHAFVKPKEANTSSSISAVTVTITENGYGPAKLTVKNGTRVTFKNTSEELRWPASNIHPTHLVYPEFDPKKPVGKGQEWQFTFTKAGVWHFHDHLFPYLTGTITVTD